jgi:ParB-like chromosome segregation protein Spo0J
MITQYEFHELCQIFPRCTDEELQLLVSDIRENGLQIPITLKDGKILDGRNRYLACQMLNIEPEYVEYDGDTPLSFVISRNLCRRHLSESQRAMVAAAIIELQRDDSGKSDVTISEAAEQLNVSERLVNHAVNVLHEGTDEDVEAIMSGEKRVRAVADEIKQQNDFALSPVDPKALQVEAFEKKIIASAKDLRRNMSDMFKLTKWSHEYKRVHRELRTIIFDE